MSNVIPFENKKLNLSTDEKPKLNLDITEKLKLNLSVECNEKKIEEELGSIEYRKEVLKHQWQFDMLLGHLLKNERYRDFMLVTCGLNLGLRGSDLVNRRFSDFITNDLTYREEVRITEKKTHKNRTLFINNQVKECISLYLSKTDGVNINDYMFQNLSNNKKYKPKDKNGIENERKHITVSGFYKLLRRLDKESGLNAGVTTHTLRRSFSRSYFINAGGTTEALLLLQSTLHHSSTQVTLRYIGIEKEDIKNAYMEVNIGIKNENFEKKYYNVK